MARWFKGRRRARRYEAFQVEVTTRCNLRCVMCPVAVLGERWPARDLSWRSYERLARAFGDTEWVHLQGWGEPLLHPRLFDMVALAKRAGCRVGFTTNGTRLTPGNGERLLDLGLDVLAVSIAGAAGGTHEAIRLGSRFERLLENLHRFTQAKVRCRSDLPKVELFYLMTRTNLEQLPQAVELASRVGADELVATNLDYVIDRALDRARAFGDVTPAAAHERAIDGARRAAERLGIGFRPYRLQSREMAVCDLNPLRILFVSADGSVSPCVYTALPGQDEVPRYFRGKAIAIAPVRFGNVNTQELDEIWESVGYRAFRHQLSERVRHAAAMTLGAAGGARGASQEPPPAPEPCVSCPKLYGV